jgi:hypothetical protein
MRFSEYWIWILTAFTPTGLLLAVAYLMRDAISRYFTKGIENRFDKKIEAFKSDARDKEKELEQIRSFLVTAQKDHDSAFRAKKFEAAEIMMRSVQSVSKLSMAVEYMKILKVDEILKNGMSQNIVKFIETISNPIEIDKKMIEINAIDMTIPRLFLDEKTVKYFDAYHDIFTSAAMMLKILGIPFQDKNKFFKEDGLSTILIEILPESKAGFDKFGDSYAYHLAGKIKSELLSELRGEVSGAKRVSQDAEFAERSALFARQARTNIEAILQQQNLPKGLIN